MTTDTRHHTYDEALGVCASAYNEGRTNQPDEVHHPEHTIYGTLGADWPLGLEEYERTAWVNASRE